MFLLQMLKQEPVSILYKKVIKKRHKQYNFTKAREDFDMNINNKVNKNLEAYPKNVRVKNLRDLDVSLEK